MADSSENEYTRRMKNPTKFIESELLDFSGNPACLIPSGFYEADATQPEGEESTGDKASPRSILIVETWDGRRVLSLLDE